MSPSSALGPRGLSRGRGPAKSGRRFFPVSPGQLHDAAAQNHALRSAIEMGIARVQMVPGSLPYADAGEVIDRALRIAEEV